MGESDLVISSRKSKTPVKTLRDYLLVGGIQGRYFSSINKTVQYDFSNGVMTKRGAGVIYKIIDTISPESENAGDILIHYVGDKKSCPAVLHNLYRDKVATPAQIKDFRTKESQLVKRIKVCDTNDTNAKILKGKIKTTI